MKKTTSKCVRRTQFSEIKVQRVSDRVNIVCLVPNSSASRAKSLGCIDRAYIVHETNIWEGGVGTTYSKRGYHGQRIPASRLL